MFVTMDIDIADRVLPSICSIAIATWEDGRIVDMFHSLIEPDCEVEEFMSSRHGLGDMELASAPPITDIWMPIYDRLDHRTVFCWDPNQAFRAMLGKAEIEHLNIPDLNYGSVMSLFRRTWGHKDRIGLQDAMGMLGMDRAGGCSLGDAEALGEIIYRAADHLGLDSPYGLFRCTGFAGGRIRNGSKMPYRAVKTKDRKFYIAKIPLCQMPYGTSASVV